MNKNMGKQKKMIKGFTLVELMALFLFLTLILAASTPIITKKFKAIPKRVHHGKYICYHDTNGNLVEDYYNGSTRIRHNQVTACSFQAPKNATFYKIELVGGGAGGYGLGDVENNLHPPENLDYIVGSTPDEGMETIPDETVKYMLDGIPITKSMYTGDGGDGQTIEYSYIDVHDIRCGLSDDIKGRYYRVDLSKDSPDPCEYPVAALGTYPSLPVTCINEGKKLRGENKDVLDFAENELFDRPININCPNLSGDEIKEVFLGGPIKWPVSSCIFNDEYAISLRQSKFRHDLWSKYNYYTTYTPDEKYHVTPNVRNNLRQACYDHDLTGSIYKNGKTTYDILNPDTFRYRDNLKVEGGKGGKGNYLSYNFNIDFTKRGSNENIFTFINRYYNNPPGTLGTMKRDALGIISVNTFKANDTIENGKNAEPLNLSHLDDSSVIDKYLKSSSERFEYEPKTPVDGESPDKYAVVRFDDGTIVYNSNPAKGGKGAQMNVLSDNGLIQEKKGNDGDDATKFTSFYGTGKAFEAWSTGAVKLESSNNNSEPLRLAVQRQLNERKHTVGFGGGAGEYKVIYTPELHDCNLSVGNGGKTINNLKDETFLKVGLDTSISCNNGVLKETAKGGEYFYNSDPDATEKYFEKIFNPLDYYRKGKYEAPASFVTDAQPGQKSNYPAIANIFNKFFNHTPANTWGAGGNGPALTDTCTAFYGVFSINTYIGSALVRQGANDKSGTPACINDPSAITVTPAEEGNSGAIIISW